MYIIRYIPNFSAVPSNRNICYFARAMKPARRVERNDLAPKTRIIRFERASDLNAAKNRMSDDYNSPFETGNPRFSVGTKGKKALQFHVIAWNVESNIERSWNRSLTGAAERKEELFRNRILATVFNFLMFNRVSNDWEILISTYRCRGVEKERTRTICFKTVSIPNKLATSISSRNLRGARFHFYRCVEMPEREREREGKDAINRSFHSRR